MFSPKWEKFGPPAGSSSGIQLAIRTRRDGSAGSRKKYVSVLSATGSFEMPGASRWLDPRAAAAVSRAAGKSAPRPLASIRRWRVWDIGIPPLCEPVRVDRARRIYRRRKASAKRPERNPKDRLKIRVRSPLVTASSRDHSHAELSATITAPRPPDAAAVGEVLAGVRVLERVDRRGGA